MEPPTQNCSGNRELAKNVVSTTGFIFGAVASVGCPGRGLKRPPPSLEV